MIVSPSHETVASRGSAARTSATRRCGSIGVASDSIDARSLASFSSRAAARPRGALADEEQRPLRLREERRDAVDRGRVGVRRRDLRRALADPRALGRDAAGDPVAREVEIDRAGAARGGLAEREIYEL